MSAATLTPWTRARPNFPQRSRYFPASVQLDLLPFGEPALKHFLYLERPEGMEREDAEGFVPSAPPLEPLTDQELMPRGQEFLTIGHLYRGIEAGLALLTDKLGERAVFVGSPRAQATPELLGGWQQLIPVTGLESALATINEIIEQGEGARGDWKDAHYGRFLGIWDEYHAMVEADPSFQPARPVLAAYTRQPFDVETDVSIISDPVSYRVAELATVAYELLLQLLTRFFTHTDETDAQLELLIGNAIELMATVIRPLGTALTKLPVGPPHDGHTAGFGFEMYYLMGNFVPWREPAWALLHERAMTLVEKCGSASKHESEPGVLADAGKQMESISSKLSAHVPKELLGARAR